MKHRDHLSLSSPLAARGESRAELQDLVSDPSSAVDKSVEDCELETVVKGAVASLPEDERLVVS